MRTLLRAPLTAAVLAAVLTTSSIAATPPATPAVNTWSAVGPSTPAMLKAGNADGIWNSKIGPDGRLYVFGAFVNVGGDETADYLAVYDPATQGWVGLGSNGAGNGALNGPVLDVAWIGSTLYAGGGFTNAAGNADADFLAAWNGSSWTAKGSTLGAPALNGPVRSLDSQDGKLYVAGQFTNAGAVAEADRLAVYDGYAWSALGNAGAGVGALSSFVYKVDALADGRVFVGGMFLNAGNTAAADYMAYWNGATWNPVGDGLATDGALAGTVVDFAISGATVYAVGSFANAQGNAAADKIAMWNGATWTNPGSAAGDGVFAGASEIDNVELYGSNVIVAGAFTDAGGNANMDGVAVWNGSKWMALGTPNPSSASMSGMGLLLSGRTLYFSGLFGSVGGVANTLCYGAFGLPAAPSAPRALKATAGSKKVTLAWTAAATANGAAVIDYVVQYRKVGTTLWKTFADGVKTTRTAVVTGLTKGANYQFRVLAKNDWGTGSSSAIVVKKAG